MSIFEVHDLENTLRLLGKKTPNLAVGAAHRINGTVGLLGRSGRTKDVCPINLNTLPPHTVPSTVESIDSADLNTVDSAPLITVLRASYSGIT